MMALCYAKQAGLNQGLITAMFATYCVFTSIIFFLLFNEKLKLKFLVGIALMLSCVILVALSQTSFGRVGSSSIRKLLAQDFDDSSILAQQIDMYIDKKSSATIAISLGLLTPFLISIFISVSRYWSHYHGYNSVDYSIDTFMVMGAVETYFFIRHAMTIGYSVNVFLCGFAASCGQIAGTCLMIYASTKGLAGPSSAMI